MDNESADHIFEAHLDNPFITVNSISEFTKFLQQKYGHWRLQLKTLGLGSIPTQSCWSFHRMTERNSPRMIGNLLIRFEPSTNTIERLKQITVLSSSRRCLAR